jgi:hypothetical protein
MAPSHDTLDLPRMRFMWGLMLQQVTVSPSTPPEYAIYKCSEQTKRPPEGGLSEEVREVRNYAVFGAL